MTKPKRPPRSLETIRIANTRERNALFRLQWDQSRGVSTADTIRQKTGCGEGRAATIAFVRTWGCPSVLDVFTRGGLSVQQVLAIVFSNPGAMAEQRDDARRRSATARAMLARMRAEARAVDVAS